MIRREGKRLVARLHLVLVPALALGAGVPPASSPGGSGRPSAQRPVTDSRGTTGTVSGSATQGAVAVAEAVVFLVTPDGRPPALGEGVGGPERPDSILVDQTRLSFLPDVLGVSPGTVVEFLNSDAVRHNVFKASGPGEPFNLGTYPAGQSRTHTFEEPGIYVILCHVHPEMAAFVMVVPSELRARTGPDGTFEITDVPPGDYLLRAWHPRYRLEEQRIRVSADQVSEVAVRAVP